MKTSPNTLLRSLGCLTLSAGIGCLHAEPNLLQRPLAEVVVEAEEDHLVQGPFLPPIEGTRINAGKKSSVLDLDELPKITNNNYRQALALTPGLLLSEETTPLVSIGYRGLDPHRVQYTQVLKDGIPIHADQFGYPEAYYTPPMDTVDRIEFIRGGAALMYGPQPGGALNYITHRPRLDRPFSFGSTQTVGSDQYYSTFNYVDGTVGRVGYYGYYNHREGDGFRTANSDFNLDAGNIKLVLDGHTDSRWILSLEAYEEDHGEPGGLTFATGPNTVSYNKNRDAASRLYDRFELKRYFASLTWEKDFSEGTRMVANAWGSFYSRYSSRQRGGGFGTLPTGADADTTSVEEQQFNTFGLDSRLRHDYSFWAGEHTVTGGFQVYHTFSPREDRRGSTRSARGGTLRAESEREVTYLPVFVENRFNWGRFSIIPGVRLENYWQNVRELKNVDKASSGLPLADQEDSEFVPLLGLGLEYEPAKNIQLYANASQSYRPKIYTQAVPTGGTTLVPNDLQESRAVQYETGFRGNPLPWATWDVSAFLLDFDDQIGRVAVPDTGFSTLQNVGHAQHRGVEAAVSLDIVKALDSWLGNVPVADSKGGKSIVSHAKSLVESFGSVRLYGNATFLDAEYVSGPYDGRAPRYAPDYLLRTGVIYDWHDRFSLSLMGTFVGDSFADDANTPEREVPGYMVWDLLTEVKVYRDIVSVHAGINNLFNEDYYARIRDDGIDPAYGRNYYMGVSFKF